jgi:hypothetical protein
MKCKGTDFLLLVMLIACAIYMGVKIYMGFFGTQIIVK